MDAEVRRLLDRQEIIDVAVRYTWALDTRDWAMLRTCFVPDAVALYGRPGRREGIESIEAACRAALGPLDASQHIVSNFDVRIDGDHATHRCYVQAQHVRAAADGGANFIIAGSYSDDLVRTEDGWRITRRELKQLWTDGNPAVLRI